MSAIERLKAIPGKIESLFPKKTRVIYGEDEKPLVVSLEKIEPILPPTGFPELNSARNEALKLLTTRDPSSTLSRIIIYHQHQQGEKELKKQLMEEHEKYAKALSFVSPSKSSKIVEFKRLPLGNLTLCQSSEGIIELIARCSVGATDENREKSNITIEYFPDHNDPSIPSSVKARYYDPNDGIHQTISIGSFLKFKDQR
jgi:hypothetical protein